MSRPPAGLLLDTLRFQGGPPDSRLVADWRAADIRGLDRLVLFESCASWLYRRLRQIEALDEVNRDFSEGLAELTREETARNMIVDAEARAVALMLDEMGVPGVFMKGIARRVSVDRYPLADARLTNDVDVLVPADKARRVWDELRRRGYGLTKPWRPPRPEHHHLPALMNERRVGVEVHTTTNAWRIPPAEAWRRFYGAGVEIRRGDVCYRVPSSTELFWGGAAHGLLHPDVGFVLMLLFSSAVIWASGAAIDWDEIRRRIESKEITDRIAACTWFNAVSQLVGIQPPPVLAEVLEPYDLGRALDLRYRVLRHLRLPTTMWKGLAWWSSQEARRGAA